MCLTEGQMNWLCISFSSIAGAFGYGLHSIGVLGLGRWRSEIQLNDTNEDRLRMLSFLSL